MSKTLNQSEQPKPEASTREETTYRSTVVFPHPVWLGTGLEFLTILLKTTAVQQMNVQLFRLQTSIRQKGNMDG